MKRSKFLKSSVAVGATAVSVPHVMVDGESIGYIGARYLLQQGHRNIVFIGNNVHRQTGFLKAFSEYSVPFNKDLFIDMLDKPEWGRKFLHKLLKMSPRPTAIFSYNDNLAAMIINEATNFLLLA